MFQLAGFNESIISAQTLRAGTQGGLNMSLLEIMAASLRSPAQLPDKLRRLRCIRQAVRIWPHWAHLSIFAIAARIR
jgi:hypothetical protein